ncbi:MAG: peptidylprolyl isomerase [Alphaproteobacteria bacterium]|nr:MAG: peptidylprolyl isomerase [Alphaproteobacteria bacterium]
MRYAWARSLAVIGLVATLAACNRGEETPVVDPAIAEARAFMADNARAEGIQTTPSGIQYMVLKSGLAGGENPDSNDLVSVHYEGTLTDGTVFDSSYQRGIPAVFTLNEVVPGWTEIVQRMKVGDEWLVYIPPELGYGDRSSGQIPPNSVLVFRMELLAMDRVPGEAPPRSAAMG